MKFKSKCLFFTSMVGVISLFPVFYYLCTARARFYALRRAGLAEFEERPPQHIAYMLFIGPIILLFSIIEMSGVKWLRWIAIAGTIGIMVPMFCNLMGIHISDYTVALAGIGYALLILAAITSLIKIIASWIIARRGKSATQY